MRALFRALLFCGLSVIFAGCTGVGNSDEEVIITKNGRPAAVLISPDEYESWRETFAVRAQSGLMKEGALKNQVQHYRERMLHGKNVQAIEYRRTDDDPNATGDGNQACSHRDGVGSFCFDTFA